MSDIFGSLGAPVGASEGEWLYRVGPEVRGPVPQKALVEKLLRGDIELTTPVAREGGEFHPIHRVKAFAPHLEEAKRRAAKRSAGKTWRIVFMVALLVLGAVGVGGYFGWQEYQQVTAVRRAKAAAEARELAKKREKFKALPKMGLVALVSLGTQEDVKIRSERRPKRRRGGARPDTEGEEIVQGCKLSQQQIFGTLSKHLAKINVCVQDEKSRDKQGLLPPQLALDFVVRPDGKVVDFEIGDRHYRTGPMKNCMVKAFRTIGFPTSGGSNCPVTIPIKIGG